MPKRFKKDTVIIHERETYQCVVCDKEIAAFARVIRKKNSSRIKFKDSFFVSNDPTDDSFKCTMLS